MTDRGSLLRLAVVGGLILNLAGGTLAAPQAKAQEPFTPGAAVGLEDGGLLAAWARERLRELPSGDGPVQADLRQRLERVRAMYFLSVEEKEWAERAMDSLRAIRDHVADGTEDGFTIEAYRGALEVVRAKHARWPPNKLKHLNRGAELLDGLVVREPANLEIRYLRLASYRFLPFFLRRDDSVAADLGALVWGLPERPEAFSPQVYRAVLQFVLDHGEVDEAEEERLREALDGEPPMIIQRTGRVNPDG